MAYQREIIVGALVALACLVASGCGVVEPQPPGKKLEGWSYAVSSIAIMDNRQSTPDEEPEPGKCSTCNGTGRVGDGRVFVECQDCGGDGVIDGDDLNDDSQDGSPVVDPIPTTSRAMTGGPATVCGPNGCSTNQGGAVLMQQRATRRVGPIRRFFGRWR